jgi:alpha-L-fucosidase
MKLKCWKDYTTEVDKTRPKRIKWWSDARYGMFVHWGSYSVLGRGEWVQGFEAIPADEYETLANQFNPPRGAPRKWAKLARDAGMKYMVLTTKHHEGYCLWDTEQTDYNAMQRGPGRDLVAEYVDACREFGLKVGFYYSLMDWHHQDGSRSAFDPEARRRFLDFTHGCVRELMTNYGQIDILWYDIPRPFVHPEGWESLALNQMVRSLQPGILINDRSQLAEDFSTPEGRIDAAEEGRGWEACMTIDHTSWGYMPSAIIDTHSVRDILRMLNTACAGQGNLLLNVGPDAEGNIPPEASAPLKTVGKWLARNGAAVYGPRDRAHWTASGCGAFSACGKKVYFWARNWAPPEMGIGGFTTKLKSAKFLDTGAPIEFEQTGPHIRLKNLPERCPETIAGWPIIELEFASKPKHEWCGSLDIFKMKSQDGNW